MKKKVDTEKQIENPRMFVLILVLLVISIVVVFSSFLNQSGDDRQQAEILNDKQLVEEVSNPESLKDYFEDVPLSNNSGNRNDVFMQIDPFREVCNGSGAGENPSISFGTVCFR